MSYRRVLLKLSGEALAGEGTTTIDPAVCAALAAEIAELHAAGVQFGIVIGGGNISRGATLAMDGMERTSADAVGMLATVINCLMMQAFLEQAGVPAVTMSAYAIPKATEAFTAREALRHLADGRVVLAAGGTGNPYFTTDTAAALRCAEMRADALLKATKVDGVYDSDPLTNPNAVKLERIGYDEALARNLRVMDRTAFSFCMEQNIPIVVFKLARGNLRKCIEGERIGSIVTGGA
ncbi:MAG: UMP kinase [Chitinivibrionales bacterium]|nr:UMP kinase [Chitinivibrionales bacterium]